MDINQFAIVRAINIIPFDGIVKPISQVPYVKKDANSQFSYSIQKLSTLSNLKESLNLYNDDDFQKYYNELYKFLPYSSDYNSMISFSISGLVPDDINNTFSNKTCVIIDNLAEQIDKSNFISLAPTDTTISGSLTLSPKAIILIESEKYDSLSDDEKIKLKKLQESGIKIEFFKSNPENENHLQNVVSKILIENDYNSETLTLSRKYHGFLDSSTSEETKESLTSIASQRNISQELYYNIVSQKSDDLDKLTAAKDDVKNFHVITNFYQTHFFKYLFKSLSLEPYLESKLLSRPDTRPYLDQLTEKIEAFGTDNYLNLVSEYNQKIENLLKTGDLLTPQQIIDSLNNNQELNLFEHINEHSFSSDLGDLSRTANLSRSK